MTVDDELNRALAKVAEQENLISLLRADVEKRKSDLAALDKHLAMQHDKCTLLIGEREQLREAAEEMRLATRAVIHKVGLLLVEFSK